MTILQISLFSVVCDPSLGHFTHNWGEFRQNLVLDLRIVRKMNDFTSKTVKKYGFSISAD
jgi:hypothetical protein